MDVPQLPLEILIHIATIDYGKAYREMLAIPSVARFALENRSQSGPSDPCKTSEGSSNRQWMYDRMTMIVKVNCFKRQPIVYMLFGLVHREDGPAMICNNGDKIWYWMGKKHRDNAPAVIMNNGNKFWYQNGKKHREDGPAAELIRGTKYWYQHDIKHRVGGPAVECSAGYKFWYQNGKYHRLDGPAIINEHSRYKRYYIEGVEYSRQRFDEIVGGLRDKSY